MSSIYIHWPFCVSKCHYCDFYSVRCQNIDFKIWFDLYKNVLMKFQSEFYHKEQITSVYFGGGTPSLMPVWFVSGLLDEIRNHFNLDPNAEITLEANPKTIDQPKARGLKQAGINRLSIGVQSIIDEDLKLLGRVHSANEAKSCVFSMLDVFENVSIDLIYNRPEQTLASWEKELNEVLTWPINHFSLYELIIENNTKIKSMIDSGILNSPSSSSEFFEMTMRIMKEHGFDMYEVSNFAKIRPGNTPYGQHNLSYWKYEDYYGIGPSSHSRVSIDGKKAAISQVSDNEMWLEWAKSPEFEPEYLSKEQEFEEMCIMGLRSKCGLNLKKIPSAIKNNHKIENKIEKLLQNSYIMKEGDVILLTEEGIKRLNLIIEFLVGE